MSNEERIKIFLRPVIRKIWLERFLFRFLLAASASGAVSLLLAAFSRIYPLLVPVWLYAFLFTGGAVFSLGFSLWKRPGYLEAAREIDRYGLEDRMVTAWQYRCSDAPIAVWQREDALQKAGPVLEVIRKRRVKVSGIWGFASLAAWALILLHLLFPNETQIEAERLQKEREIVKKIGDEAEERLVEEKLRELTGRSSLEKMDLQDVKSAEELMQRLLNQEHKTSLGLQRMERNLAELQDLSEGIKAVPNLEQLGQALQNALQNGNAEKLQQLLEQLTPEQKEALNRFLSQWAATQEEGELRSMALHLQSGNLEAVAEALDHLQAQMDQLSQLQSDLQQVALRLQQEMSQAGLTPPYEGQLAFGSPSGTGTGSGQGEGGSSGMSNGEGNGGTQGNGQGEAGSGTGSGRRDVQGTGNGASNGSGQGSGQGGGTGSGDGNGSGQGGGTGSGNGSGSGQGGNGQGRGGSAGGHGTGSRQLITVPERIDGGSGTFADTGTLGEGESQFQQAGQALVLPGTSRPYREVYGEYEREARRSLARHDLPDNLQDAVRKYFSSIEP